MLGRLSPARSGAVVALGLLAACTGSSSGSSTIETDATPGTLRSALSASATRSGVPRDLLIALAKVEDGLTLPAQRLTLDAENEVPAAGPLQLRRGKLDTLRRGAELVGASEIELRRDGDLALEAGALVLAELGAKTGARGDDLASWREAIEEMSGFADEAHREHYTHQVFATLARGGRFEARDGEIVVLPPHDLPPTLTLDVSYKLRALANQAEYAGAEWIPTSCTNKCVPGRNGASVELVVIHDTEGNWNASVATLQNDPNKSVQYIIGVDGRVGQFVVEDTTAWHAGNSYVNQRSVGIEHVGYHDKPFPEAEYAASAKLVDYLATKYDVPRDRAHIIGHDQVPNGNKIPKDSPPCDMSPTDCHESPNYGGANRHVDPGIWEWSTFMARFAGTAKCTDAPAQWTCAQDAKQAFRCAGTAFELKACDGTGGCASPTDPKVDAVCNVAPKTVPTPAQPAPKEEPEPTLEPPPAAQDSGCAVGPRSAPGVPSGALAAVAVALGAVLLRRRRA